MTSRTLEIEEALGLALDTHPGSCHRLLCFTMPREAPAAKIVPFYTDAGQCRQSPEKLGLGSQRNTLFELHPWDGNM